MVKNSSTLIATLGSKPQLITLAMDCLHQDNESVDKVIVVHASQERPETRAALERLDDDFPKNYPGADLRYLPLAKDGKILSDITSPEQVHAAFQALYSLVHAVKMEDRPAHLLIAGGRRTLTVFGWRWRKCCSMTATISGIFHPIPRWRHRAACTPAAPSGRA